MYSFERGKLLSLFTMIKAVRCCHTSHSRRREMLSAMLPMLRSFGAHHELTRDTLPAIEWIIQTINTEDTMTHTSVKAALKLAEVTLTAAIDRLDELQPPHIQNALDTIPFYGRMQNAER